MNKMLLLAGVAAVLVASNANAVELNPYVGAKLRYVDMSNDAELGAEISADDKVWGGSVAFGVATQVKGGAVRAELEYNLNEDAKKTLGGGIKAKIETQSAMANVYYDIDTGTKFTPYVGAGLGYAKVKGSLSLSGVSESMDDNNFAWQVGAGASYALNSNVSLDAGYRYVDYGDFTKDEVKLDTSAHELYVGARYAF